MVHCRLKTAFIIFLVFISAIPHALNAQKNVTGKPPSAYVDMEGIKHHLEVLAGDSLKGRATGSKGERKAARYIAEQLRRYNLESLVNTDSYLHSIPMHGSRPLTTSECFVYSLNDTVSLKLFEDYLLYKSGAQTFRPRPVPLVFVGYGIQAPEFDYNDYNSVDVRGKIAVMFEGEPESDDPDYFSADEPTVYSYAEAKQRMAIANGAIGTVIIMAPAEFTAGNWQIKKRMFSFEDVTLAYRVTGHLSLLLNPERAPVLFKNAKYGWKEVRALKSGHALESFELNTSLSFEGAFAERDFMSANVIALREADQGTKGDRYVVISAHYDHLGVGPAVKGDSIYNGAMDNAIGVSAALEIARIFSQHRFRLKRSLIFLFVTGEEKGLLGSRFFMDHAPVKHHAISANINIDGLAMFDTFNNVVGVGKDLSDLGNILDSVAIRNGLYASPVPAPFSGFESFARSDQIVFARSGVPSILIMDGLDYRHLSEQQGIRLWKAWIDSVYHSPFDDLKQSINFKAARQHIKFLCDYIYAVAIHDGDIRWKEGTPFINIRLQSKAERR